MDYFYLSNAGGEEIQFFKYAPIGHGVNRFESTAGITCSSENMLLGIAPKAVYPGVADAATEMKLIAG
jgi:hypothetical protein